MDGGGLAQWRIRETDSCRLRLGITLDVLECKGELPVPTAGASRIGKCLLDVTHMLTASADIQKSVNSTSPFQNKGKNKPRKVPRYQPRAGSLQTPTRFRITYVG